MATELKNTITVIGPEEATKAIAQAYKNVVGKAPTPAILALMAAQWSHETGNGKSVHNYNFGNKKWSKDDPYYIHFRCWEVVNGVKTWYEPPHPACKFAAYRNATEGAEAFVKLLKKRPNWWNGLHTESASGFVDGLAKPPTAYFTANKAEYLTALERHLLKYTELAKKYAVPSIGMQVIAGIAVSGALWYGWRAYHDPNSRIGQIARDGVETAESKLRLLAEITPGLNKLV